ncbi:uncharacterized protein LOC126993112 isoform X9 [Eriocheir sinensis]|uniref:uncharacterized protein LOC126993112 isoform X9 n=1 Tax=Eriocheir sinensis TaxID=95602 RepID=UPI0021C842AD|nr:uncharacterized protein LOC126993112 isoform X9 [Eriocheir sinensis]
MASGCGSLRNNRWCSSAGRCHNTGHSSPQQQSLHRQVILHQQAFQQLGEIGWCSSAGRCHNTGHSSPQQQSLHRQVILHQQAFQQLGEIDTTKRRRGGGGGGGRRRRGTQEEPIECAVSRRQTEMSVQFCRRKRSRVSQL